MQIQDFLNIKTIPDLLSLLQLPEYIYDAINQATPTTKHLYDTFVIPKKKGKREIFAPKPELKKSQKIISLYLDQIYHPLKPSPVYGFITSDNHTERPAPIFQNASKHVGKRYVYNVDIENFFRSISFNRIKGVFINPPFSFPITVATLLSKIVSIENRLPEGSPASPVISNWVFRTLDYKIIKLCKKYNIFYTRYADDLTFSANKKIPPYFTLELSNTLAKYQFSINQKKLHCSSKYSRQIVTGLVVNEKVNLTRDFIKNLRGELYFLHRYPNKITHAELSRIKGKIAFAAQIRGNDDAFVRHVKESLEKAYILLLLSSQRKPIYMGGSFTTIRQDDSNNVRLDKINAATIGKYINNFRQPKDGETIHLVKAEFTTKGQVDNYNPNVSSIEGEKGTVIALAIGNEIIGYVDDKVFQYKTEYGQVPFYKKGTREFNEEFQPEWISLVKEQVEEGISSLKMLLDAPTGSIVEVERGKFRFTNKDEAFNLKGIGTWLEENNAEAVFWQRRMKDEAYVWYKVVWNKNAKRWAIRTQYELTCPHDLPNNPNVMELTYQDKKTLIVVDVDFNDQVGNLEKGLDNLLSNQMKSQDTIFFSINSDQHNQQAVLYKNKTGSYTFIIDNGEGKKNVASDKITYYELEGFLKKLKDPNIKNKEVVVQEFKKLFELIKKAESSYICRCDSRNIVQTFLPRAGKL